MTSLVKLEVFRPFIWRDPRLQTAEPSLRRSDNILGERGARMTTARLVATAIRRPAPSLYLSNIGSQLIMVHIALRRE